MFRKTWPIGLKLYCLKSSFQRVTEDPSGTLAETWCSVRLAGKHAVSKYVNPQRHILTKDSKETNGQPKSAYHVTVSRNWGWPKGRESYGHGVPVVVRERESRSHGKGAQVVRTRRVLC